MLCHVCALVTLGGMSSCSYHDGLSFSLPYPILFLQLPRFHYSQVRVKFEGEDGSGPGVNRGYFAAFANALKNNEIVSVHCCYDS